jgi:hypothetical protein
MPHMLSVIMLIVMVPTPSLKPFAIITKNYLLIKRLNLKPVKSFSKWPLDTRKNAMFVERKVYYSSLFTNLVGWHAGAVSFPLSDVILAQLASLLSDIMFCLHSRITNLSLYKHCTNGQLTKSRLSKKTTSCF